MKIGYDFIQPSASLAGCGWYTHELLDTMAALAPEYRFLAYRHFGQCFMDPGKLAPLPGRTNITDPLAGQSLEATVIAWENALAQEQPPGRPDLVHSTSFQSPRFKDCKLVVTIFDLSFWAVPEYTTENIRLGCQAGVLNSLQHADGLIFISEHARREFDRFLPDYQRRGEIATIVTPLASRWPAVGQATATSGDYWLFVGSIEPRKNLLNLLTAYEGYALNHPAPRPLWLAGGRGWRNDEILARIKALEFRSLVRYLGHVPEDDLQRLYRNAHALVFPSWYEGFGLPVLEAMGQGCPVICSDRTSLPEVGGDAVHYIDPADPATLTAALLRLEQDPAYRNRLVQRGLVQAAQFSWEQTAKQTLAFYEQILSAPPANS
jgi:glycosyltransferase involved in cell wall biosynthesis